MALVSKRQGFRQNLAPSDVEPFPTKERRRITRDILSSLREHIPFFKRVLREQRFSGGPGLIRRTDRLLKSVKGQPIDRGDGKFSLQATIGSSDDSIPQAHKQEVGGTISAIRTDRLTIPLDPIVDPRTRVRRFRSSADLPKPRGVAYFRLRSLKGNLFFAGRFANLRLAQRVLRFANTPTNVIEDNRGRVVLLLYLLRQRVKLKPRLKFAATFNSSKVSKHRRELLTRAIQGALIRATRRVFGRGD